MYKKLIIAFVIFLTIKMLAKIKEMAEKMAKKKEEEVVVSQEPRTESQDETQEALLEENKN